MIICFIVPDMARDRCNYFISFWAVFCPFTARKNENIIILYNCRKNHDHMLYCSSDIARDGCNCHFSFWVIFCPFTTLTARKNEKFKKWKKTPGDIIIQSPFISSAWRSERDSWITETNEAIDIAVEVSERKASKKLREVSG